MPCSGAYANAKDWAMHWDVSVDDDCESQINRFLRMSATQIHAAMQANGQCDCALSDWATDLLKQLNMLIGAAFYNAPCSKPALSVEERKFFAEQARYWLDQIRTGQIELCAGATGADYPSMDWAEMSHTEFAAAQIIANALAREEG